MDDEDGTCLLDVLCDPQALNDFLHGTNELETDGILINSSDAETTLFTAPASPVSILADDPPVENHQPTNCVDLSFLEEALLASPPQDSSEDGACMEKACEEQEDKQEKEACDILQQSLQEADITEQTLAEEAGLAAGAIGSQPADIVPLYVTSDGQHADLGTLLQPPSHALPKALTVHPMVSGLGGVQLTGLQNVPKDTQAAVEPPQPSLMAVGPGCPSLIGKPTPPQLMSLLPGTVFPAPTSEQPLALNPAHGSSVLIQKTVPNVSGSSLFSSTPISHAIRANMGSSLLIPRAPLPIQPKLPVSIQPRLVQISPKPISTTVSPNQQHRHPAGVTFVSGNPHQNFLLSAAHNNVVKQQSSQGLAKPVSLQLLNQTSSIVIQPQGIFPTPNQFILPGHLATTSSPSISQAPSARSFLPNQSSSTQPLPVVRHSTSGPLVDTTQLLATPSGQLNFGQVFTTPNGQFAVRQGAILSGPFQFQTSAPTIFQMPTQLTSSFSTQSSGPQNGNTVQPTQTLLPGTTSLGNQITVLNSSGVLGPALSIQPGPGASIPDLASVSIMNGQPVVHGVQSTTFPAQNQPSASLLPSEGSTGFQPLATGCPAKSSQPDCDGNDLLEQQQSQTDSPAALQTSNQIQHPAALPNVQLLSPALLQGQAPDAPFRLHKQLKYEGKLLPEPTDHDLLIEVNSGADCMQNIAQKHLQQLSTPPSAHLIGPAEPLRSPLCNQTIITPQAASHPVRLSSPLESHQQAITASIPVNGHDGPLCSLLNGQPMNNLPSDNGRNGSLSAPLSTHTVSTQTIATSQGFTVNNIKASLTTMENPRMSLPLGLSSSLPIQRSVNKPATHLVAERLINPAGADSTLKPPQQQTEQQISTVSAKMERSLDTQLQRQRFQHQINKDHTTVMNPDCSTPFHSVEDAIVHLLPYHTFVGRLPTKDDFSVVDEQFETVSSQLLKRTQEMLNKYRQLMLQEIQQVKQSAEMVMLERLFLHDERVELREVQKVRRLTSDGPVASNYKPVSYVSPANQPTIPPDTDLPLCVTPNLAPIDPPCSSPPLRLMFDCTKSLRTYPSRKRGGLKLTIKQEAGYSKVVRNSVCEPWAVSSPASTARSELEPINMDNVNGNSKKEQTWDSLDFREAIQRLPAPLEHQQSIFSKATGCGENTTAMNGAHFSFLENKSKQSAENGEGIVTKSLQSGTTVNHQEEGLCPSFRQNFGEVDERCLETGMPAPYAKRPRSEPSPGQEERRCKSPQADSVLSEHLQSAIDSILLLQKLQGQSVSETPSLGLFEPPSLQNVPECGLGTGEPSALEEAVKSILEDKM
ncbi:BRD4-interacting chromatin-remodeling complex-associated protein [Erpetoichthys calabaricus]|uniref:BRD4-interacting chromatin-remodeling complex-associated protein n=1 Tax=Erpetoichthys calabaricus TaxID=27687 RepID=UPI00109FFCD7|nr:BRD4-interacting chromatin-remodeling complex-associated protein [Erpetoichthys calabaricus]